MTKQSDWRPFADRLTALSKSQGQKDFLEHAFRFINEFVLVDNCTVFKVSADKNSGAEHLCTIGKLSRSLTRKLAENYIQNGFKNDPMVQTALLSAKMKVRRLSESFYDTEYKSQYFDKADLIDKVSSLHSSRNVIFIVSFYRKRSTGRFTNKEFADLQRLGPIIGRFVLRHVNLTNPGLIVRENSIQDYATHLVNDSTQIFSKLSAREREVCVCLLSGREEKDIATELKIKLATVITHRRRLYSKLNIISKVELFQLAMLSSQTLQ